MEKAVANKLYAESVEGLLKKKKKIDLSANFDYQKFLDTYTSGVAISDPLPEINLPAKTKSQASIVEDQNFLALLKDSEERAAVSGKFNPSDLLPKSTKPVLVTTVLSAIAPNCMINTTTELRWQMYRSKRKEVLNRMIGEERLEIVLQSTLPETDEYGKLLRTLLREKASIKIEGLSNDELHLLATVLEALDGLDISKPELSTVTSAVKAPGLLDEYAVITRDFIGRAKELEQLLKFFHRKEPADMDWSGIIVTGVGGAGKSTLIAKFVETIIMQKAATVAILDFDRPGLTFSDPFWLTTEIMRQIGDQYPLARKIFTTEIQKIRTARNSAGLTEGITVNRDGADSYLEELLYRIGPTLRDCQVGHLPILIVFDTVEEVVQNDELKQLHSWLNIAGDIISDIHLKIVFSGRLFNEQLKSIEQLHRVGDTISITDFDKPIAREFMKRLQVSEKLMNKIIESKVVPLRPLELKLTARVLNEGKISFASLERELVKSKKKSKSTNLFTGIIYRRVLKRISDRKIRAIAYPGLILRYLTPEIIVKVLQPALKLRGINEAEATDILNKLGKFSWLATREGNQLWHQKDLRRSMLQLMIADKESVTDSIRKHAIEYFGSLKTREGNAEVQYHRLMDVRTPRMGDKLDLDGLKQSFNYLKKDRADLSKAASVLLEFSVSRKVVPANLKFLSSKYQDGLYHRLGKDYLFKRQYSQAYELYKQSNKPILWDRFESQWDFLTNWESESMFVTVHWDSLLKTFFPKQFVPMAEITGMYSYLFPRAITHPEKYSSVSIEKLLLGMTYQANIFSSRTTSMADQSTVMNRLAVSLVILNGEKKLTATAKKHLLKMVQRFSRNRSGMRQSVGIMTMLAGVKPANVDIDILNLRIDADWLKDIFKLVDKEDRKSIHNAIEVLESKSLSTLTWKQLSAGVFSRLEKKGDNSLRIAGGSRISNSSLFKLLKGPDNVFREPVIYAMHEAFANAKQLERLAVLIDKAITLPLKDATLKRIRQALLEDKFFAIERYVEIIDRCWGLPDFVQQMHDENPNEENLAQIHIAMKRYHKELNRVLKVLHTIT